MTVKILLADDHQILRQGLRTLLEKERDVQVVAEAQDGRTAVRLAKELAPDMVIMDIGMPDLNGIEATRQIALEAPGVKIIGLSMFADRRFVVNMLKAGARGYLLKDCAFEELGRAIRVVMAHKIYLSPEIAHVVMQDLFYPASSREMSVFSVLTAREREVLQLMAEGNSTSQIANQLHVSVKTIETHRQQIMQKLNMHSVAQLTKYAIREGLTSVE
ncbi:MAG: response regulator transcription factor [Deltaproteobacteria bacterium]|nr:response regulator transcription factor [Deltaproteobacteria bacterium]